MYAFQSNLVKQLNVTVCICVCVYVSVCRGLAKSETSTGDVYFVPAFSGLFAPYWETDARGLIIGLTNYTNKIHLCQATLEAVCFQSREVSIPYTCNNPSGS